MHRLSASPETWLFVALGALAIALVGGAGLAPSASALSLLLALCVAVMGLPHGAMDPWVARRAGLWRDSRGLLAFHLGYLALAACVVLAWHWAPGASLAMFLALSGWHFGGDWREHLPRWARATAGLALLALPAWRWPAEVAATFQVLAGPAGERLAAALLWIAPALGLGIVIVAGLALRRSRVAALELVAIAALALLLPPLVYFIVYFCALHSVRHLRLAARDAGAAARPRLMAVALGYTALTLVLAAVAWPWMAELGGAVDAPGADRLRLVFIGLAALTLPHMLVVMYAEPSPRSDS